MIKRRIKWRVTGGTGAKTFSMAVLTVLLTALVWQSKRLEPEKLAALSEAAVFSIGFFTITAGIWLSRLLRWGMKGLPPLHLNALSFVCCFLIAILCFDANSISQMFKLPVRLAHVGDRYCPDEDIKEEKPREKKQGCDLIYRAYDLGMIKSLGSCAEEKTEKFEVCGLRQHDEPLLHYSWRQLDGFFQSQKSRYTDPHFREKLNAVFKLQLDYSKALFGKLKNVVRSAPKASHHIFTNLPYPEGKMVFYHEKFFTRGACITHYGKKAESDERGDSSVQQSRLFETVEGEMLFDNKYEPAAGICEEYTIHWNAPIDACERLTSEPVAFLHQMGSDEQVETVLKRLEENSDLRALKVQLRSIYTGLPPPLPPPASEILIAMGGKPHAFPVFDTIVSFQCFMRKDGLAAPESKTMPLRLYNHNWVAREEDFPAVTDPRRIRISMYRAIGDLMAANGFKYEGSGDPSVLGASKQWSVGPDTFAQADYPFTRLEWLKDADIFSGHGWLQDHNDLLQVYPFYKHLSRFIGVFREEYRSKRTRL